MARLNDKQYLRTHKQLRRFWEHNNRLYAELTSLEQWQLHDYFQPSKDWPDEQLLEHRAAISAKRPSLPHQAGRALNKFHASAAHLAVRRIRAAHTPARVAAGSRKRGDRVITVKAVVRPEIDYKKLTQALIGLAKQEIGRRNHYLGHITLVRLVPGYVPTDEQLPDQVRWLLGYETSGHSPRRRLASSRIHRARP